MRRALWFSLTLVLCITLSVAAAAQTTINVPADQTTIQAAINAANNGDTVVVAPGTYTENLNFNGKAITVTSSGGSAVTIVDGGGIGPVVIFEMSEGANSVLNGFTLRNGVSTNTLPLWNSGAGITIYYASPTITNNLITGNHAGCGIGIEIVGGSSVIRGNTITGNTQAFGMGGCGGGGIEVAGDSSHPVATPVITGNTITNNTLNGGGFGGGIGVSYFASPTIQNNYIAGNSAYNSGGGIDLESYSAPLVMQNIIVNNAAGAGGSGGGIYVQGPSSLGAVVANNTVVGNTAYDGSSGIYTYVLSPITISNNIVVPATAQNGIVCSPFSSTLPTFSHNDVVLPAAGGQAWAGNCASAGQSNGNISADPQFVNATNGDYHLQFGSPAIDVGDNAAPNLLRQDYDGKPRIVDGNNDCVDTIDIGAYEFQPTFGANFSPASLSFSAQRLNTISSAQPVTLSSTGTSCVKTAAILVTGSFAQSNTCGIGVPAGALCTVSVTFTPTARGTSTGMLAFDSSVLGTSVSLAGTGVASVAGLTPASLTFASQGVGTASTAQTLTLTNSGDAALNISSVSVSGDFQQTNNCGTVVAFNSSCSINITFTPSAAGTRSGTLTVLDDSVGGNQQTAALSGTGAVATIGLAIDAQVSADQGTAKSTVSTVPFSTVAGNELLLAFIATDYTSGTNTTVKSVIGGGLTWVLVVRSNKQSGTSEIWRAFAPSPLSNLSVTATLSHTVVSSMTVVSFAGVNSSGSNGSGAIGATKSTNAASGAPTATLATTQNNSWVFGVGNDFDNATGRTPGAGQVLVHQDLSPTGDTYWVQRQTAPTPLSGTIVTIKDTAPTVDRYNLAICEVLHAE